jgi:putative salt-induced outer membrane protein
MHVKTLFKTLTILGISLASFSSQAAAPALGLNGSGELGFTDSSGNTTSTTLFGALRLNYNQANYEIKSKLETNYKSENNVQTEEHYLIEVQSNRYYNPAHSYYSFVGVKFEKNRFASIELNTTLSLGLGKQLFKNEATKLTGETGLAQQIINYTNDTSEADKSQTALRLKLDLRHQINVQVAFTQDITYLKGSEQATLESNTGFKVKVADRMNLKVSYKYKYNDSPAAGVKETDTQTLLTLIYDF